MVETNCRRASLGDRPMKICLIGGIYGKGGVRTSYVKSTPETNLEAGLRLAGHEVTTLSHYDDVQFAAFDITHVHHLSYGATRLASDKSSCPFVFTAHDASQMNGVPMGVAQRLAMRYVLSRADGIVSLSMAEADFQQSHYPTKGALLETIPNGIPDELFPLLPRTKPDQRPWKILFVGQLIALKGCDLLLRALARIRHPFELCLAYQTDLLQADLAELARSLGIAKNVKFLGKQDPAQLAALYQTSDLLILPSATEALPSVITEAMLSGLPFIATAVGGVREQAAGFGYLLQSRTTDSLALAINTVLDRYPEFAKTADAMSAHARSTFSMEAMVKKHLHLYERIAARGPARRSGKTLLDTTIRLAVRRQGQGSTPTMPSAITEPT